ncbi:MAG: hypothetical protein RL336_1463, partial [Pseudomonadota bacterium]
MKSFSKLFLTAFIVSVLSIGLIITQANSQRDIQARAHSLVTKNVALLADVNHLHVLINREIMAGSDYLQGGDEAHFNERHLQFHDELTATLDSLTNTASSNKHLANISANVLAYHRVLSDTNPAEAPPQQISQAIIVLQQQSTELTVLIDELHQQLAQDIGEAQTAISRAGNNAMIQTTLMALAL